MAPGTSSPLLAQALATMSKIFIGNVSYELNEDYLQQTFSPFGPIKSIHMQRDPDKGGHKGFAFIDFEVPESARLAEIQMNGATLGGRNIKTGRPSNIGALQPFILAIQQAAAEHSWIYVSSIHEELCDADLRSVFDVFGTITCCYLNDLRQAFAKHRGFGYIEFSNRSSAIEAVSGMNLFELCGLHLRVCHAISPPELHTPLAAAKSAATKIEMALGPAIFPPTKSNEPIEHGDKRGCEAFGNKDKKEGSSQHKSSHKKHSKSSRRDDELHKTTKSTSGKSRSKSDKDSKRSEKTKLSKLDSKTKDSASTSKLPAKEKKPDTQTDRYTDSKSSEALPGQSTIIVRGINPRNSDFGVKQGLFHKFKRLGRILGVKVCGGVVGDDKQQFARFALVSFDICAAPQVEQLVANTKKGCGKDDLLFMGGEISIDFASPQLLAAEDNEQRPFAKDADEYHMSATRTFYVANLDEKMDSDEQLSLMLATCGEILSTDVKNKDSVRPYAFVEFADISSVVRAQLMMKKTRKTVKTGFGKSLSTKSVWLAASAGAVQCSESSLRRKFEVFGRVKNVAVDADVQQALVDFESAADAEKAVQKIKAEQVLKRELQIDFATQRLQDFFDTRRKRGKERLHVERELLFGDAAKEANSSHSMDKHKRRHGPNSPTSSRQHKSSGTKEKKNAKSRSRSGRPAMTSHRHHHHVSSSSSKFVSQNHQGDDIKSVTKMDVSNNLLLESTAHEGNFPKLNFTPAAPSILSSSFVSRGEQTNTGLAAASSSAAANHSDPTTVLLAALLEQQRKQQEQQDALLKLIQSHLQSSSVANAQATSSASSSLETGYQNKPVQQLQQIFQPSYSGYGGSYGIPHELPAPVPQQQAQYDLKRNFEQLSDVTSMYGFGSFELNSDTFSIQQPPAQDTKTFSELVRKYL